MSRSEKQLRRLESLEQDLVAKLKVGLEESAEHGYCWVFNHPDRTPYIGSLVRNRPRVREILDLVSEIHALRQKLGEPEDEGIVGLYEYWSDHYFSEDDNRLGPKRLAQTFLAQIDELEHSHTN